MFVMAYHQLLDLLLKNVRSKATVATIEKKEEAKKKLYTQPCRDLKQNLSQIKTSYGVRMEF
jgi:hypothetical protein